MGRTSAGSARTGACDNSPAPAAVQRLQSTRIRTAAALDIPSCTHPSPLCAALPPPQCYHIGLQNLPVEILVHVTETSREWYWFLDRGGRGIGMPSTCLSLLMGRDSRSRFQDALRRESFVLWRRVPPGHPPFTRMQLCRRILPSSSNSTQSASPSIKYGAPSSLFVTPSSSSRSHAVIAA